jgi:hypothetical protein
VRIFNDSLMLAKFLALCSFASVVAFDLYPWGNYNFKEHTDDMLEGLRENEHLKVWDSTIERSMLNAEGRLTLANTDGFTFELKVQDPNAPKNDSRIHPARNSIDELTEAMAGTCAMLIDGYWSYEYCHG